MGNSPFMYWVGMNTQPGTSAEELAKFDDFYSHTHAPEVLRSNPGFQQAYRYELCEPDPRGDFGPRWLAVYEMDDEEAAKGYIGRDAGPPEGRPIYTPGPEAFRTYQGWWRLIWQRIAPREGDLSTRAPYIYMVGMNVPPDTTEAGLAQFNEFYTNIHVPEVVALDHFRSGVRYELYRALRHPEPGAPRFLAVYEADEASKAAHDRRVANPAGSAPLSSGPAHVGGARDTLAPHVPSDRLVRSHRDFSELHRSHLRGSAEACPERSRRADGQREGCPLVNPNFCLPALQGGKKKKLRGDPSDSPRMGCAPAAPCFSEIIHPVIHRGHVPGRSDSNPRGPVR